MNLDTLSSDSSEEEIRDSGRSFQSLIVWGKKLYRTRRDVPVGVPLDLSTPTGMSCIGTYGENCKSDNVSKYRVLLVAFLLLWHEN